MGNTDDGFKMLTSKATVEAINSTNEGNKSSEIRLGLALTGMLLFVGNDAVKIIFRKNFGIGTVGIIRLILLVLIFTALGILFMNIGEIDNDYISVSTNSFSITGIVYVGLAAFILFRGVQHIKQSNKLNIHPDDEGEANLLSFLQEQYGWKQVNIQYFAEPFYTLFIAALLFFYNPIGAIPLAVCALSVWLFPIVKIFSGAVSQQPQQRFKQPDNSFKQARQG
jgi:hypothetical protein